MSTIGKSVGLATAFLAGIVIAANAGPLSRADASASAPIANPPPSSSTSLSSSQPQCRELAALPPTNAAPAPNSVALPHVYQVPEDYANIALDPYKRGVSPRPGDQSSL
jgi:hypothetical protein